MRTSYGNSWNILFSIGTLALPSVGPHVAAASEAHHEARCPMRNDFFTVRAYTPSPAPSATDALPKRARKFTATPNLMYISLISRAARVPAENLCGSEVAALDALYSGNDGETALPKSFQPGTYFANRLKLGNPHHSASHVRAAIQGYKYLNGVYERVFLPHHAESECSSDFNRDSCLIFQASLRWDVVQRAYLSHGSRASSCADENQNYKITRVALQSEWEHLRPLLGEKSSRENHREFRERIGAIDQAFQSRIELCPRATSSMSARNLVSPAK